MWTIFVCGRWFHCEQIGEGFVVWGDGLVMLATSLTAAAKIVRKSLGFGGKSVSGPRFWAVLDEEKCGGCGVPLTGFRPKIGWLETWELLKAEQRSGERGSITRHTVLGKMKELRAHEWEMHRSQCERASELMNA